MTPERKTDALTFVDRAFHLADPSLNTDDYSTKDNNISPEDQQELKRVVVRIMKFKPGKREEVFAAVRQGEVSQSTHLAAIRLGTEIAYAERERAGK